jgi:TIR domain
VSDIFVSYSRKDRAIAGALADILPSQGWTLYWDRQLRPGEIFDDVLEREVTGARCVVVLWSSNSVGSQWVRNEADVGASRNALISVLIENVTVPLAFRRVQAADLIGWKGDRNDPRLRELLQAIAHFLGAKPQKPSPVAAEPEIMMGSIKPLSEAEPKHVLGPRSIERAEQDLAPYVGPIARTIVAGCAKTCHDVADLYKELAQYVPAKERGQFLRRCPEEPPEYISKA